MIIPYLIRCCDKRKVGDTSDFFGNQLVKSFVRVESLNVKQKVRAITITNPHLHHHLLSTNLPNRLQFHLAPIGKASAMCFQHVQCRIQFVGHRHQIHHPKSMASLCNTMVMGFTDCDGNRLSVMAMEKENGRTILGMSPSNLDDILELITFLSQYFSQRMQGRHQAIFNLNTGRNVHHRWEPKTTTTSNISVCV